MHLLVIRISSIGDVVLTVPVLTAVRQQYPEVEITVVSRGMYRPLFAPLEVNFIAADIFGDHKGLVGIRKLYQDILEQVQPDAVIDIHSVLRSHVLGSFFKLSGVPVYKIDKGRHGKRELTRQKNKIRKPLRHTTQRYADVFREAGLDLHFDPKNYPCPDYTSEKAEALWQELRLEGKVVGIAPISTYPGKTWPITKVEELIRLLSEKGIKILLFGGPAEKEALDKLASPDKGTFNIAGKLDFGSEVALMKKLQLMVSMDSSNMHLATLAKIPVVSIWGATHRFAGFGPLGENEHLIAEVPVEQLECRPCSVFGNKPCFRKDYACMHWLEVEDVMRKVIGVCL